MPTDQEIERVVAIALAGKGRSKLYRWLYANHDKLAPALEKTRPDWNRLTAEFVAMGLTPEVQPGSVRNTWWRVRKAVAVSRAKLAAKERAVAAQPQTGPAVSSLPAARSAARPVDAPDKADVDPDNPFGFKVGISKRDWTKNPHEEG